MVTVSVVAVVLHVVILDDGLVAGLHHTTAHHARQEHHCTLVLQAEEQGEEHDVQDDAEDQDYGEIHLPPPLILGLPDDGFGVAAHPNHLQAEEEEVRNAPDHHDPDEDEGPPKHREAHPELRDLPVGNHEVGPTDLEDRGDDVQHPHPGQIDRIMAQRAVIRLALGQEEATNDGLHLGGNDVHADSM